MSGIAINIILAASVAAALGHTMTAHVALVVGVVAAVVEAWPDARTQERFRFRVARLVGRA